MRKYFLLLLTIAAPYVIFANDDGTGSNNGNDNNTISLMSRECLSDESRLQMPVFHAEINANKTILVQADRPTDFEVTILDAKGMNVRYRGVTIDDVLHITTQGFSLGCYTLRIETDVCTYSGEFEISHAL